jgi:hypothetical protein
MAIESSDMISAPSPSANSIPTCVFPLAVGPVKNQASPIGGKVSGLVIFDYAAELFSRLG